MAQPQDEAGRVASTFDASADPVVRAWCEELQPPGDTSLHVQEIVGVSGLVAVAEICMQRTGALGDPPGSGGCHEGVTSPAYPADGLLTDP